MDTAAWVAATWEEIGHRVRPLGFQLFVRVDAPRERKYGSIILPPRAQGIYAGMPHECILPATVLAVPTGLTGCLVKAGDRVAFARLGFTRWQTMENKDVVGWIPVSCILGTPADEIEEQSGRFPRKAGVSRPFPRQPGSPHDAIRCSAGKGGFSGEGDGFDLEIHEQKACPPKSHTDSRIKKKVARLAV